MPQEARAALLLLASCLCLCRGIGAVRMKPQGYDDIASVEGRLGYGSEEGYRSSGGAGFQVLAQLKDLEEFMLEAGGRGGEVEGGPVAAVPEASSAGKKQAFTFGLKVLNLTYAGLVAEKTLLDGVVLACKKVIAHKVSMKPENISLAVYGGSIVLQFIIIPQNSSSTGAVRGKLCGDSGEKLQATADEIASALTAFPGLDVISTGDLSAAPQGECVVEDFTDPRLVLGADEVDETKQRGERSPYAAIAPAAVLVVLVGVAVSCIGFGLLKAGKAKEEEQSTDEVQGSASNAAAIFTGTYSEPALQLHGAVTEWDLIQHKKEPSPSDEEEDDKSDSGTVAGEASRGLSAA